MAGGHIGAEHTCSMVNDNIIGRQRPDGYGSWNSAMDQAAGVAPAEFAAYTCNEEIVERFARSLGGENIRPSMLIAPSRLGSGVLRAQIPDNLVFTVTNGTSPNVNGSTRVGPNGLIETAKTNLALQSEAFNVSGTWTLVSGGTGSLPVVSANAVISPDGTQNAETVVFNRGAGNASADQSVLQQNITILTSGTYTFSVYAKASASGDIGKQVFIRMGNAGGLIAITLTANWTRYSQVEASVASGSQIVQIGNRGTFTAGNPVSVDLWGAQVEVGSSASEYIPTTTVARTRFAGVDVNSNVNTNAPRLDYLGQSCPALLVEPSGQNTFIESQTLFTTHLVQNLTSGYTNAATSPDGSVTAEKFVPNTTNGVHGIANGSSLAISSGTTYTFSLFVKSDGGPYNLISLTFDSATAWGATRSCIFNASNGTNFSVPAGATMTSENYGNGWYRIRATLTAVGNVAASLYQYRIYVCDALGSLSWAAPSSNTNGIFCWGAQLEVGSVATTYIPTTTAAVTRNADVISASGVSGLIGQTEGTMYAEVDYRNFSTADQPIVQLFLDASNRFGIAAYRSGPDNRFQGYVVLGGGVPVNITYIIPSAGIYKIAFGYKLDDYVLYINGTLIGSDTSGSVVAATSIQLGHNNSTNFLNDRIRATALYTTRLSNEQLMLLTSPTYYGDIADMSWAYYLNRSGESVPSCLQTRNYQLLQV